MPSKKKKYNARFPAGRIKKIMQTDDEVGKVAQAVPVIISRTLELFVKSLITKSMHITMMKNARTLSPHHMKQCILSESRFDFLRDLVKSVPEVATSDDDNWVPSDSQTNDNSSSTSHSTRRSSTNEVKKESNEPTSVGANFYMETDVNATIQSESNDSDSKSSESDRSKELHIDDNTSSLVMKSDEDDDYDT
uniref:Dr1-associated corepressor n=1 Tax=Panstrongylus megistus TaxID=65343 RepID=A0A069DP23_9HEMI